MATKLTKLTVNRGTLYSRTLSAFKIDGVITSLVGATVRFTMKTAEYSADTTDSDAVVLKNITDGTAEGVATIILEPSDTAILTPQKYNYDIKVDLNSDGLVVYKVDEGTITLDGSPTNRLS